MSKRLPSSTTSLPYNLTVKGGAFSLPTLAGSPSFHDHDLPFVNRPVVLDRFVGGESRAGRRRGELSPADRAVCDADGWHV